VPYWNWEAALGEERLPFRCGGSTISFPSVPYELQLFQSKFSAEWQ